MDKQAEQPDTKKSFTIVVNGTQTPVTGKKQSYEDIVKLAYPNPDFSKFAYTVMYFKGEHDKESDLVAGESVSVKDEEVFNVRRSDKS